MWDCKTVCWKDNLDIADRGYVVKSETKEAHMKELIALRFSELHVN